MNIKNRPIWKALLLVAVSLLFVQCEEDNVHFNYTQPELSNNANDVYLRQNMLNPYYTNVIWRWQADLLPSSTYHSAPIKESLVIPVTKMLQYLWLGVYEAQGAGGVQFIKKMIPAEIRFIGSTVSDSDGSSILGYAESGVRLTLVDLNSYDLSNRVWLLEPGRGILQTIHHEFSHIVEGNYGLPKGFNTYSSYLGASWQSIPSSPVTEAIKLGFTRNYSSAGEREDFCEIVSYLLTWSKDSFEATFITQEDPTLITDPDAAQECREVNAGKEIIAAKVALVKEYYQKNFGINMEAVRDTLQNRLNYVFTNNNIPL